MSYQNIAVGIDLSPSSELAAEQAVALARHCGARVVLVHVGVVPEPIAGLPESMRLTGETYEGILRARLAEDRAAVEALRQRLIGQGVEVSHVVVDGFADAALVDAGRELNADLLAVGTHGRTGIKRVVLGSVAEKTVRLATTSVLVARGDGTAAEGGYHRIVVGTDFSPLADNALARALEVASAGAHVHVVHAWALPAIPVTEGVISIGPLRQAIVDDAEVRTAELLAAWRGRATGVELEGETCEAPAQHALIDRAETLKADLIVVGSHGRRGVRRMMLGSVAETTVRHAPCSVLVAR